MAECKRNNFSRLTLKRNSCHSKQQEASSNKCHASSNRCLTSSNKKLVETIQLSLQNSHWWPVQWSIRPTNLVSFPFKKKDATSNKCIATRNKGLTTRNKKLLGNNIRI